MNKKFNQLRGIFRKSKTDFIEEQDSPDKTMRTIITDRIKKHKKQEFINKEMLTEFESGTKKYKSLLKKASKIMDNAECLDVDGLAQQINSVQVSEEELRRNQEELSRLHYDHETLVQNKIDCQDWMSELMQKNQILAGQSKELMDKETKIRNKMAENISQIARLSEESDYAEIDITHYNRAIKRIVNDNCINFIKEQEELSRLHYNYETLVQNKIDCQVWTSELMQKNQILAGQLKELMDKETKIRNKMAENTSQITQLNNRNNRTESDINNLDKKIQYLTEAVNNNCINFIKEVDQLELGIRRREVDELEFSIENKENLTQRSPVRPLRPAPLPPVKREGQNMPNLDINSPNTLSEVSLRNSQDQVQKR